jgi:hypothetical protein
MSRYIYIFTPGFKALMTILQDEKRRARGSYPNRGLQILNSEEAFRHFP